MSLVGRWRIIEMPDYDAGYPDMMEPAFIQLEADGSGEFAFGCVTGQIFGSVVATAAAFRWMGNDEMDEAEGDGSVELRADGALDGQICLSGGDEVNFVARRWTSSTAC